MCKLIYDESQVTAFVDNFFMDCNIASSATASLFIKKGGTVSSTRLVRKSLTKYDYNLGQVSPEAFIKDLEKLNRQTRILEDDNGDPIKLENLALYANVNTVLFDKALPNTLRTLLNLLQDFMLQKSSKGFDYVTSLNKLLLGKGGINAIIQDSLGKLNFDYDLDIPNIETKRRYYNLKIKKFFSSLLDWKNVQYYIISTKKGYHVVTKKVSLEYIGNTDKSPELEKFYKEIIPNGYKKNIGFKDVQSELLPIYLGINTSAPYEFILNKNGDGTPIPGTLQKGYKVKFI